MLQTKILHALYTFMHLFTSELFKCTDSPYFKINASWLLLQQWLNRKPHDVLVVGGSGTASEPHAFEHTREITSFFSSTLSIATCFCTQVIF